MALDPFYYASRKKVVLSINHRWFAPLPEGTRFYATLSSAEESIPLATRELKTDDPRWEAWREAIEMSAERLDAIEFNPDLPD